MSMAIFSPCHHVARGTKTPGSLFVRALIPLMWDPTSWPNHLPNAPPPNITLEIGFNIRILENTNIESIAGGNGAQNTIDTNLPPTPEVTEEWENKQSPLNTAALKALILDHSQVLVKRGKSKRISWQVLKLKEVESDWDRKKHRAKWNRRSWGIWLIFSEKTRMRRIWGII